MLLYEVKSLSKYQLEKFRETEMNCTHFMHLQHFVEKLNLHKLILS